jgi:hypothetical protein
LTAALTAGLVAALTGAVDLGADFFTAGLAVFLTGALVAAVLVTVDFLGGAALATFLTALDAAADSFFFVGINYPFFNT